MQKTSFTLTREERLKKAKEFLKVKKEGKKYLTGSFLVYVLPNGLGRRRLGLSISGRVGTAARRNRIKRILKEFFRTNKDLFPESSDILISVKKTTAVKSFRDAESEITPLCKKWGVRGKESS